ncbi:hypothetical protein I4U23_027077 [Adineta vaga]|nr:hypothetical protein I4U23_027077 [Adineta vaga]
MTDTESSSNRKEKYATSFLNTCQEKAESILGFKFNNFYRRQTPIEQGFPEATIAPMNESVVTDNVGMILITMVSYYRRTMHRNDLELTREKQIIRKDEQFGGNMEFVVTQMINAGNTRYVLVVEAKRIALGKGLTQLLLALKSMWDINNDKKSSLWIRNNWNQLAISYIRW